VKVLDSSYLIDYLNGTEAAAEFYETHGGADEHWVMPAPAYAETIVGIGNLPDGDVQAAISNLAWGEVHAVDKETAVMAAEIADEISPQGPFLSGMDGLIAAVGRELDAPVVSADTNLTHEETKNVLAIEEYLL
jgi:predicted nucleic acid-binding protein